MKRKISTPIGIAILVLFTLPFVFFFANAISADTQPKPAPVTKVVRAEPDPITVERLHELVNKYRVDNGLSALAYDKKLEAAALDKCEDMVEKNYWSHNTPDGAEPWVFLDSNDIQYKMAGENLSQGYSTSTSVVNGWIGSDSHKENLDRIHFKKVGYGICTSSIYQNRITVVQFLTQY